MIGRYMSTKSNPKSSKDEGKRDFLIVSTYAMAGIGAASFAWPLIDQMNPAADTLALASTEIDLSSLEEGQAITVKWRGKPVFVRHRTAEEIKNAKEASIDDMRDPEKDSDVKYLTYPFYAGGNRGRGQVYPTGEKSNVNVFGAPQAGQITAITVSEKGDSMVEIVSASGVKTSQAVPKGLDLLVKAGDIVTADQDLNINPNAGGFGQEESEIVLQNPIRIVGYLVFCFFVLLTQIFLVLKKKQFEKVQAAELNF